MYIRKTNSGYVAEIYVSGVRRSKSFPLKRDAAIWATGEENALRSEVNGSIDTKRTLRETLERYRDEITARNTGERWERIRIDAFLAHPEWLPLNKKIGSVTTEDFSKFRDERLKTVKPGTVLREFGLLSGLGLLKKLIPSNASKFFMCGSKDNHLFVNALFNEDIFHPNTIKWNSFDNS